MSVGDASPTVGEYATGLSFRGDPGDVAVQEWTVAGESDYRMTYKPLPYWPHVVAGGVPQTSGRDYTVSGQTLTVLDEMDLRPDEELWVRYDYLEGMNAYVAAPEPVPLVPIFADGYGGNIVYFLNDYPVGSVDGDVILVASYSTGETASYTGPVLKGDTATGSGGWKGRLWAGVKGVDTVNLSGAGGGLVYAVYRGVNVASLEFTTAIGSGTAPLSNAMASTHDIVVRLFGVNGGTSLGGPDFGATRFNGALGSTRLGLISDEQIAGAAPMRSISAAASAPWAAFTVGLNLS